MTEICHHSVRISQGIKIEHLAAADQGVKISILKLWHPVDVKTPQCDNKFYRGHFVSNK